MKNTTILFLLVFPAALGFAGGEAVQLERATVLSGVDETVMKLDIEGRILVKTEKPNESGLFVFDPSGDLITFLPVPGKAVTFFDFAFVPRERIFLLSVRADGKKEVRAYDEGGIYIGPIYVKNREGKMDSNLYFPQIIPLGFSGLVVNTYSPQTAFSDPLLREVTLEPYANGYKMEPVGRAFSPQLNESRFYSGQYFRRFIVPQGDHMETLAVVSELEQYGWFYGQDPSVGYKRKEPVHLNLAHRISPIAALKANPYSGENPLKIYYSFSRIQGLFCVNDNYRILAYSSPNENHPFYAKDGVGDEKARPFELHLACVDENLRKVGRELTIKNRFVLGVDDNRSILTWNYEKGTPASSGKSVWHLFVDSQGPVDALLGGIFERWGRAISQR